MKSKINVDIPYTMNKLHSIKNLDDAKYQCFILVINRLKFDSNLNDLMTINFSQDECDDINKIALSFYSVGSAFSKFKTHTGVYNQHFYYFAKIVNDNVKQTGNNEYSFVYNDNPITITSKDNENVEFDSNKLFNKEHDLDN